MCHRKKWLLGVSLLGLAGFGMALTELTKQTVYYYTPEEAIAQAGALCQKKIRVGGMVIPGSLSSLSSEDRTFSIGDLKDLKIQVSYRGGLPDMFKEGSGVIVQGYLDCQGEKMKADLLMVKHSEDYRPPGNHKDIDDQKLVQEALFKEP